MTDIEQIFASLNIQRLNPGCSSDAKSWAAMGAQFDSLTPSSNQVLAQVVGGTDLDYERVVAASQNAFQHWRRVPAPERGEVVRQLGQALREHKDALGSLVALEMGKIKQEGDGEVQEMIDMADFAVGQARMLYGKTMHSERPQHRMYEQWHPLGPVGVISAFNFPVAVWSWNAFIAAICGNTVIWKPSSKTPLCAIAVQHICNQVMAECGHPGIFSLFISNDRMLSEKLLDDHRLPLISFTGSTKTGRHVAQKVAGRLGKTILELGGNNAIIVDEMVNLDLLIPAVVFGAVGTAGQRCTSTRRLLIHQHHFDEVVKRLVSAYAQVRIGNPLDSDTLMGPLIDETAVGHYEAALAEVVKAGGKILYGGKQLDRPGHFVEPTLVLAENHYAIVQQETFAPILYLIKTNSLNDAITLHNDVAQGLSSALFTDNLRHAEQFLSNQGSDCGIANINIGTSGAEIGGAFGGEKETGGGREAGSDAWKAYMRRQTNTINWSSELPLAQGIKFKV